MNGKYMIASQAKPSQAKDKVRSFFAVSLRINKQIFMGNLFP